MINNKMFTVFNTYRLTGTDILVRFIRKVGVSDCLILMDNGKMQRVSVSDLRFIEKKIA